MKRFFLITFMFCIAIGSVNAQDITAVTEEWPPYNYTENNKVMGVVTEIVKATLNSTGMRWKIEVLPWARAYKTASVQENVLIYTIFRLPNRENLFKWIKIDGLSTHMYLFSPKFRSDIVIHSLEDAKKYKIGVTRETSTHHFLTSKGFQEQVNLFPVTSEIQNAFKADPGRRTLDLTTGDRLSLARWLKIYNFPPDYWKEELLLFKQDFYMAVGKKTSDAVVDRIRAGFEKIKADGTLEKIVEKYNRMYR